MSCDGISPSQTNADRPRWRLCSEPNKENLNGGGARQARTAWVRRNPPARLVVGRADDRVHGLRRVCRLCHVGRVPERALHLRTVSVPLLFARVVGRLSARRVRTEARLVARIGPVLTGAVDLAVSGAVPLHLLLLSRRLLQGVLVRSAVVRRG